MRATLFPQRNPSAAERALVLITPHPWSPASPPPLERFPAASRNVATPNPATHRCQARQLPAPPLVVAAVETAAATARRVATPLQRPSGSAPVLTFPATLTSSQAPRRAGRRTLLPRTQAGSCYSSGEAGGGSAGGEERGLNVTRGGVYPTWNRSPDRPGVQKESVRGRRGKRGTDFVQLPK